jgi:dTMP kinase
MKKPLFIVFEGPDGSGKSTQLWRFAKFLSSLNKHNHLVITREPYKSREIRQLLHQSDNPQEQAELITQLFIKDRQEHLDELINPSLKKEMIVISDRYKYSTICYQAAQGQDINKLIDSHKDMKVPDIVFVIDSPIGVLVQRMNDDEIKRKQHKFEKDKEFLNKVRHNYLAISALLPNEKIIIIDGTKTKEEVFDSITQAFLREFPE